jgi:predicted HTH transcriptional regulator
MKRSGISALLHLRESVELEAKLALGADGKGAIPRDFWSTYSAFANTHGGVILLGVRESRGTFSVEGIPDIGKMRTDLFNLLNSRDKVSVNLLHDEDVREIQLSGKSVLQVSVPAAGRKNKPVHLHGNPFGNTYRRLHDGDRRCDDDTVRRMIAEQVDDSRDLRILKGFDLSDLALDSLHTYRRHFASLKPDHPWTLLDDRDFLRVNGCWRKDRETGDDGLTMAALLMFGQGQAVLEAAPLLFLDYQELPAFDDGETRWIDRIVPDGTWSGNLYDFYRKVAPRLMADLKVPFVMKGDTRQDDTPQHKALREALINALVHADYSERASVRIQKSPAGFSFRNPGTLRVPAEHALQGGESDCRNRTLHQLFLQLGLGERAGSGLPKIRHAWEPHGYCVTLTESFEPYDQSVLVITAVPEPIPPAQPDEGSVKSSVDVSGKMSGKMSGKILELLAAEPSTTIPELASALGVTTRTIERNLGVLQDSGRLRRVGPAKGGHWEVVS